MLCWSLHRSIFINGMVFSCHLLDNDTSYYDSYQNYFHWQYLKGRSRQDKTSLWLWLLDQETKRKQIHTIDIDFKFFKFEFIYIIAI